MGAITQYFHVVMFILLHKEIQTSKPLDDQSFCATIKMKAMLSCATVLAIVLHKVVLTFKSVDETLVCDRSNESYRAVLSCGNV